MNELPLVTHADAASWDAWLKKHHATSDGVWLELTKGVAGALTYQQALDVALAWGWIDGQKRSIDATAWKQLFTRRRARSIWSQRNCEKAEALIKAGKMNAAGLAEVDRAKADGRWQKAYASPKNATVPADLVAALAKNKKAEQLFTALDAANRYAILFRIHNVKKADTRAKKIAEYVAMLARGEVLHPERLKKNTPAPATRKKAPRRKSS